ncbi:hypothetical protein [Streptomyces sp. NBC_00212]|uniref:hypothetical protein n=1 Tax=Streptomyces sp. NBC_00212 TaxID=2975684 RepID=UPI00324BD516
MGRGGAHIRARACARYPQEWTYGRGPDGRRRRVETFRFNSADLKNSLRDAVLEVGWSWRGVLLKL